MNRAVSLVAPCLLLASCGFVSGSELRAGYASLSLGGEIALDSSVGTGLTSIDLSDDLNVDDAAGTFVFGGGLDTSIGNVSVSGFLFSQDGRGTLSSDFGDIPAGTSVESSFDFDNLKAFWSFDVLDLEVFRLAPGVGVDLMRIDATVESVTAVSAFENIDVMAPVPMLFLEGEVDVGLVNAVVEAGWMSVDLGDADGTFWDVEARVDVPLGDTFGVFAGYRYLSIDSSGDTDGQAFDADLTLDGWMLGGRLRF